METVNITIDGIKTQVPKEFTVLEAAKSLDINIPTLCHLKGINEVGACRICVVEVKGARTLQASCVLPVSEGMEVKTCSPAVMEARKTILDLILSRHERECTTCSRNLNCELQKLCDEMGIDKVSYEGEKIVYAVDQASPSIVRDQNKCVLCGRCIAICRDIQHTEAINFANRGIRTTVTAPNGKALTEVNCINCGQCIKICPVGALREKDDTHKVWSALGNPDLHVVVQTAPAVRVGLGEEFGMPVGTNVEGKMITALKRLGFDKVFDTDFSADLTILEEGTELLNRIKNGGKLPLITSCSPGWIKFCEHNYHEFLDNLSTCKSPQQMMGAVAKSYYAEKAGIDPKNIFVVSVMPCTAKKFEANREEMALDGLKDVDVVLTTRELAKMIKQVRINFTALSEGKYDSILGDSTGAAVIFGATGGVMEAALRTVADILTGQDLKKIDYTPVRGMEGIKEASVNVDGVDIKVAVAHGTGNAAKLLDSIKDGKAEYHFIEVMACPGGCINGGGQPILLDKEKTEEVKKLRAQGLYKIDKEDRRFRKSHENPEVKKLYEDYLEEPNSHISHRLLHTKYIERDRA
ncbi:MAG TPA: NADH-dependent [FeFe] hydrogenase, group A6 [Bacillota bacterium]|nr:NADH-dependent [FeFe] hydrogenase, group A6 [Bacillota bacterium]HNT03481.1 NADH-dependent [FeFe] hydrogenase, group A6 [Bacillota bacterium]HPX68666.1 NADH-dependent [FeFe] hydrogenase, group A6 [Bacillota bacterium]HQA64861.1 NADH-dependent [FeFe] hydrogenase, group A6 [Bacillota bacterium]HQO43027.1 NADH-dependent [FeFe] hydrogenase, group A6 [Bacillota bacterium]